MKKSKSLLFLLLALSVFFLAGCAPKKPTTPTQTKETQEQKSGFFESIKDAMAKSLSLQCDYSVNEIKSTVYIKGKSLRSETDTQGKKIYVIIKEDKLWSWNDKEKNGLIIDLSERQIEAQSGQKNEEEIIKEVEEHKQNCRQTIISDSLFNPPTNIEFQDLSEMWKKIPTLPQKP